MELELLNILILQFDLLGFIFVYLFENIVKDS